MCYSRRQAGDTNKLNYDSSVTLHMTFEECREHARY